jgi:hypothetical protein
VDRGRRGSHSVLAGEVTVPAETDYAWRLEQWQDYLDVYWQAGMFDQIIGVPLSLVQSMAFRMDRESLQYAAHSGYVSLLVNSGLIGVALFVLMVVVAGERASWLWGPKPGETSSNSVDLAIAIIISHAVFCYAYMLPNE